MDLQVPGECGYTGGRLSESPRGRSAFQHARAPAFDSPRPRPARAIACRLVLALGNAKGPVSESVSLSESLSESVSEF